MLLIILQLVYYVFYDTELHCVLIDHAHDFIRDVVVLVR